MSTILITGATDGIGLALARIYQTRGARVILVGRRSLDQLDSTLFTTTTYCQADLSHADCAESITHFLHTQGIQQLDLLIHNAGIGSYGPTEKQAPEKIRELVTVNLLAPIALTHAQLPLLRQPSGKIVFISSVASALATPQYAVYSATKAALDGLARNLRIELRDRVAVQLIHPGATRTGMHAKSGISKDVLNWERFPAADRVASQITQAIDGQQASVTIGLGNRLLRFAGQHLAWPIDGAMRINVRIKNQGLQNLAPLSQNWGRGRGRGPEQAKTCLITGAADGIGRALAYRLAAAGYAIIGIDVDAERAKQTQAALEQEGATVEFIIANLASEAGINDLLDRLSDRQPIDLLIHNAGINAVGAFGKIELARQRAVILVNLLAPLLITAGLLREQKIVSGGSLVFISSLSHFASYPGASTYAASKDGLASYARSLSVACSAHNIHVLTVYPGPTRTAHARRYSPDNSREARRMPPEQVADAIFRAVKARQRTLIPGIGNRLFATFGWMFPSLTEWMMRKTLFEKLVSSHGIKEV